MGSRCLGFQLKHACYFLINSNIVLSLQQKRILGVLMAVHIYIYIYIYIYNEFLRPMIVTIVEN